MCDREKVKILYNCVKVCLKNKSINKWATNYVQEIERAFPSFHVTANFQQDFRPSCPGVHFFFAFSCQHGGSVQLLFSSSLHQYPGPAVH